MLNDSVITGRQKVREIIIFLVCFAAAFIVNIYSIIRFSTPWTEIFTQIGFVCIITGILYVLVWIIRIIVLLVSKLVRKK